MPQIQKAKAGAGHDLWLVYAAHGGQISRKGFGGLKYGRNNWWLRFVL